MKRFWRSGDPWVWLTGGALALSLVMVGGLVVLILVSGMGFFWPSALERFRFSDGTEILGEVTRREAMPNAPELHRLQVKRGNKDLGGADFVGLEESKIASRERPREAVVLERREWGNLYGELREVRQAGQVLARGPGECLKAVEERLPEVRRTYAKIRRIEKDDIGAISAEQNRLRLKRRGLELGGVTSGPQVDAVRREEEDLERRFEEPRRRLAELRGGLTATVLVATAGGKEKDLPLSQIVRIARPNTMGLFSKIGHYLGKWSEFIFDEPREANTEGGIFPAIFGTVLMVLLMSLFVTPLGVLSALYLREYAKQGPLVSAVRIAVNNLAGVPSIVFGVFGVGFFIYTVGGSIDRFFFPEALPTPTYGTGGILWASLTLALLTVPVVIVATEEGLAAIPRGLREASLALGATRWETTWRVVIPALLPSILTGVILAMARAAGEVAPLMITGVVKLAPTLALDGVPPFLHPERKFMHLGFHIYDVGFQSPNVDAARPMVFMTTTLLLGIVVALNLAAIVLRKKLRQRLVQSAL